jgi:hypothetical protein
MHLLPRKVRLTGQPAETEFLRIVVVVAVGGVVQLDSVLSNVGAIIFSVLGRRSRPYVSSLVGLLIALGRMADWVNHRLVLHRFPSAGDVMDL